MQLAVAPLAGHAVATALGLVIPTGGEQDLRAASKHLINRDVYLRSIMT